MESPNIIKLNYKAIKPPSYFLDLEILKKLFKLLQDINDEEAIDQISKIIKNPENSDEAFEKYKNELRELYKINVQIYCADGNAYVSKDESIFDESKIPVNINKIVFDNLIDYRLRFGQLPPYTINVSFDFSTAEILDFSSNPSNSTINSSIIELAGSRDTWLEGAHQRIKKLLEPKQKKRAWIHKQSIYDFFLWIIFLPIMLVNLFRFMASFSTLFNRVPGSYQAAIYIYIFIFSIFTARIIFNYARWLFPLNELKDNSNKSSVGHRLIFGAIILGIISSAIYDIFKSIFD
jgi:hypothetical protein